MQIKAVHTQYTLFKTKIKQVLQNVTFQGNDTHYQLSCILTGGNGMVGIGVSGNGSAGLMVAALNRTG